MLCGVAGPMSSASNENFACEDKREDKCEAQASKFERGGRGSKFRAEASKGNREKAL